MRSSLSTFASRAATAGIVIFALAASASSQGRACGTPAHDRSILPDSPSDCGYSVTVPAAQYAPTTLYTIPVVVHVIQATSGRGALTDAQVQSQIDILNEDFRALAGSPGAPGVDTMIQFVLADRDPSGAPSTGITRSTNNTWFRDGGNYWRQLAWDTNRYMNLYTNNGGGALGYVPEIPQSGTLVGTTGDRVVCAWDSFGRSSAAGPPFNQGRTATHEVGHYLGLLHTFDGGCGGSNCYRSGDLICDTNPEQRPAYGCPTRQSTCGSPDPVSNYMDYSDDLCMTGFTAEQTRRMRCTLENWRPNLATTGGAAASVTSRTGGANPDSYAAQRPLIGTTVGVTVNVGATGHSHAKLLGFAAPADIAFRGYALLVDITSPPGGFFDLPPAPGPMATQGLPIPAEPSLAGLVVYTQAVHFGGAPGFALSNAQDLRLGTF
ncbi:MAG: zinc metalloprotease [Planctomycetota bacterium]